jgi:predicted DNA-binding transcriptional regulator YafY
MSAQMNRLFQIILMLPRYPKNLTTGRIRDALANQGIEIHIRTIERDMMLLENALRPRISCVRCKDKTVRWFWTTDAKVINPRGLTTNQALTFSLLKKYLTPLFPSVTLNELEPFFEEATTTLESFYDNPLLDWPKKIAIVQPTQPLLPQQVDAEIQTTVSEALLTDRQLQIVYQRSDGIEQNYLLNPLGLVQRGGISYLIASKVDTNDERIFALHRIKVANQTDQQAIRPEGFELQEFIASGKMGFNLTGCRYQPIQLKAVFDRVSITHLYESRLSDDQVIEKLDDDRFMITATVQETEQLFWWLQSFGSRVEILEPSSLRQKMIESVEVLAKKYGLHQKV